MTLKFVVGQRQGMHGEHGLGQNGKASRARVGGMCGQASENVGKTVRRCSVAPGKRKG